MVSFVSILSIEAYRAHHKLNNVKPAIHLDASQPHQYWGGTQPESLDLVLNINMIHISPMACTEVEPMCRSRTIRSNERIVLTN